MKKWIPFAAAGVYALYALAPTWYTKHADKHAVRHADGGKVMLTFDDGPDPRYTGRLLDLLARYHVPASFFVTAEHALACPELIAEMKRRGHLIGFHSASHQNALLTAPRTVQKDFERMKLAADYLGVPFRWYRPPWGHANLMTRYEIRQYGLRLVLWGLAAKRNAGRHCTKTAGTGAQGCSDLPARQRWCTGGTGAYAWGAGNRSAATIETRL